ncbi:class I SAM-dependent methyltransferase [Lichenihabitans psoromatis]|uniref:class I SAM-dependent methyltransferase n=1 Tax=Lichenihabitans psoromatis TaxID=2528642 RepID=UPI003CCA8C43
MSDGTIDNVYGFLPDTLFAAASDAVQFSPLVPGGAALDDKAPGSLQSLTMLAPPGTIERRYAMALALRALAPGAPFTILAPKDRGGSRLGDELRHFGCDVIDEGRRHHRICTGLRPPEVIGLDDAITEGGLRRIEALGVWSQPGVFSWDRLDPGSALLIQHLPALSGRGADFGCGIGILANAVLTSPKVTHLDLIDIDRRAIAAARHNVDDPRATIRWADVRRGRLADLTQLDFVVMNPPFHDAGTEDRSLGQSFITRAAEALRTGGRCWLTANRHMPYEAVLKPLFKRINAVADAGGYKIYEAQK